MSQEQRQTLLNMVDRVKESVTELQDEIALTTAPLSAIDKLFEVQRGLNEVGRMFSPDIKQKV